LGKFPVVFAFLDAVFGVPPEYLTLTDAFGNFTISKKRIHTNDFKILSQKAALLWEGSLGFDQTLDFTVTGRFAEDIIKQTTSLGRLASALLHEAGAYMVEARLKGMLLGHVTIGVEMLTRAMDKLETPEPLRFKIIHMIMTHMGDYGSNKAPSFPEALTIFHADQLDAKVLQMSELKENAQTEDDYFYHKEFGNVYLR
ncbi:MAG: hypothetical protein KKC54_05695, partial [Nanoarchaeota archaeon]|nr:hypothetical protein [Nanoarchaeota archaeon]